MSGTAAIQVVQGIVPEYASAARRYAGEEGGNAWLAQVSAMFSEMARIAIRPGWVGVLDFQTHFPTAIEMAMAGTPAPASQQTEP